MPTEMPPRYAGPRELAQALTAFAHMSSADARWDREGLRDDAEYRDLGLAAATGGRITNAACSDGKWSDSACDESMVAPSAPTTP